MNKELSMLLLDHWKTVNKRIKKIKSGLEKNFWVKNQSYYLEPVIEKDVIAPLNNERGLYNYYLIIKNSLGLLIAGENVKYTYHFNGAPKEIKQLLDKS